MHSSSSGAGSGSDESLSVASSASSRFENVPPIPSMNRQNGAMSHQVSKNHGSNNDNGNQNRHLISNGTLLGECVTGAGILRDNGQVNDVNNNKSNNNDDHDYEDIYLVREEVRSHNKTPQSNSRVLSAVNGSTKVERSRSRDSGSHSRSASASSNHSTDYVIQYGEVNFYVQPKRSILFYSCFVFFSE